MSARLNASTDEISGRGAPSLTTTPTPTLASVARVPAAILSFLASSSMAAGVRTATSNASPPSIRLTSAPTVSLSTVTLWPVFFSKSGTIASTTCLNAPAVSTFTSAAVADDAAMIVAASVRAEATSLRMTPLLCSARRHPIPAVRAIRVAAIGPALLCRDGRHLAWHGHGLRKLAARDLLVADHAQRSGRRAHLGADPRARVEHRRHDPGKA